MSDNSVDAIGVAPSGAALGAEVRGIDFAKPVPQDVADMLLWDNRCAMHHRTLVDPTQRSVMHRALIKGEPLISAWEDHAAAE